MWHKILAIALVLVMVLSFTACAAGPSAQEIVDGVIEALDDIKTHQFDMDMTLDMAGEAEGEAFEATMVLSSGGALDFENRQMRIEITRSTAATGEDEMEMGMEMYLIDDMIYMMTEFPLMGTIWTKSEMTPGYWEELSEQMNQVEPQIELLEVVQVKVIGSEKVGGIDCYVLQLTPDMEQLWQMVLQQIGVIGEMPAVPEEFLQEIFKSFSVKQWVAKDTYFLIKVEIDMAMELTPEALGFPEEEGLMIMDITIVLLAYDYNQPVSIVLPPEAEEAVEVPLAQGRVEEANTEAHDVEVAVLAAMVDNDVFSLTAGGTVGPLHASLVMESDGVTELDVDDYFTGFLEATYTLDAEGAIASAMATAGGRWDGLTYTVNYGWSE